MPDLCELRESHPHISRVRDWNELAGKRQFEKLFTRILDESGIIRRELFMKDDERALTNYLHIFEILLEDAHTIGRDLVDLVAALASYIRQTSRPLGEDGNVQRLESDRSAVQIMTIHKSKGLESAVVFLFGGFSRFRGSGIHEYHELQQRVLYIGENDAAKQKAEEDRSWEEQRLYYLALTRAKARLYLPLVPARLSGRKWDGSYWRLNEQLHAVASDLEESKHGQFFELVPFHADLAKSPETDPNRRDADLAGWQPDEALFRVPYKSWEFSEHRRKHAGYIVSSYSRMKRTSTSDLDPLERDEFHREPGQANKASASQAADELPGGTATGTMLHEVLETIPFNSVALAPSLEDWLGLKPVKDAFDRAIARSGIWPTARQRRHAEEMIYRALTMTISLGPAHSISGLHCCRDVIREMEFLLPFPEVTHPPLSDPRPGKLIIERGFIKGFVDLVVQCDSRVYFADWKSDVLPSYGAETISEHIDVHYDIQLKLYSLALVRALRVRSESAYEKSFGGLFYVFLRALGCDQSEACRASISSDSLGQMSCGMRPSSNRSFCHQREHAHEKPCRSLAIGYGARSDNE